MPDDLEALRQLLDDLAGARLAHRTILGLLIAGLQNSDVIDADAVRAVFGAAEQLLAAGGVRAGLTEAAAVETVVAALLAPPGSVG